MLNSEPPPPLFPLDLDLKVQKTFFHRKFGKILQIFPQPRPATVALLQFFLSS